MKRLLLLILTFGLLSGAAYAHNGMEHVMGVVTAISDASVSVKTMNGRVQTVVLSHDTRYLKGTAAIGVKDIRLGDHVVIHATRKGGKLTAAEVKVGMMKGTHGEMSGMKMNDGKMAPV